MEYKVLACLLNNIPITTVWYEISYFDQASYACCWSPANRFFFFAGQMVYPWGPILIEYIHMEPKYGIQGVKSTLFARLANYDSSESDMF